MCYSPNAHTTRARAGATRARMAATRAHTDVLHHPVAHSHTSSRIAITRSRTDAVHTQVRAVCPPFAHRCSPSAHTSLQPPGTLVHCWAHIRTRTGVTRARTVTQARSPMCAHTRSRTGNTRAHTVAVLPHPWVARVKAVRTWGWLSASKRIGLQNIQGAQ